MITYANAEAIWLTRRAGYDTRGLRGEFRGAQACHLSKQGDVFAVYRHGSPIVWIHPDHYVVNLQGWEVAPTTRATVQHVTGAWMGTRGAEYEIPYSIGGAPYFAGIRVHPNGRVFDEDRKPWRKRYLTKEAQRTWRELTKWLRAAAEARVNIGEFAHGMRMYPHQVSLHLGEFLPTWKDIRPQDVTHERLRMFRGCATWEEAAVTLRCARLHFYHRINAYEYRETK